MMLVLLALDTFFKHTVRVENWENLHICFHCIHRMPVSYFHCTTRVLVSGTNITPMVMMKLIYHWSCQTNINNVVQWVKVSHEVVDRVYTINRCIAVAAVQVPNLYIPGVFFSIH